MGKDPDRNPDFVEFQRFEGSHWSLCSALVVVQFLVVFVISYFLPPQFTVSRIREWRCVKAHLVSKITDCRHLSEKLGDQDESYFDVNLSKEERVRALMVLGDSLVAVEGAADQKLKWNFDAETAELTFGTVQDQVEDLKDLTKKHWEFVLNTMYPL